MGSFAPGKAEAANIVAGDLIKGSRAAVYYYGIDGGRYCFPNDKVFFTWYDNFSGVKTITDAELAAIPLRGNVTYRPGSKMVKVTTIPNVYVVDRGRILRWVRSEETASVLYGSSWKKEVNDIDDALFVNYRMGFDVVHASDFNMAAVSSRTTTIDSELGLTGFTGAYVPPTSGNTTPTSSTGSMTVPGTSAITAPATVLAGVPFTLSWPAQSTAFKYTVQKFSSTLFTNPVMVYDGPATSVTDKIWTPQYYRVRAESGAGTGAWSAPVYVGITNR